MLAPNTAATAAGNGRAPEATNAIIAVVDSDDDWDEGDDTISDDIAYDADASSVGTVGRTASQVQRAMTVKKSMNRLGVIVKGNPFEK